ncbi:MAG: HAD family hydrolase [Pirellulaceae bacterium]
MAVTKKYRAILFDLDGTLLNTLADLANSVNAVLDELEYSQHPIDRFPAFIGDGVGNLFRRALPGGEFAGHSESLIADCVARFQRVYGDWWNRDSSLYDGIDSMLDELVAANFQLAVLSNKPHDFTKKCVAHYFSQWPFEVVLGQRSGVPRKPDPQAPLEIAQQLGVAPTECAFVGDSDIDMQTGVNSQMLPIGVAWGFRSQQELIDAGAVTVLQTPGELLTAIQS